MKKSVYEATTDMFIKRCEARIAAGDLSIPWKKTWDPSLGMPRNMVSGKAYRGSNVFFTLIQGYTSPFWLTRKQVKALGGEIKTQEDGSFEPYTPITFWWFPDRNKPKDEGRIPFAKFYQVWNTEQVSGIEDKVAAVFADMGTGEPVNPGGRPARKSPTGEAERATPPRRIGSACPRCRRSRRVRITTAPCSTSFCTPRGTGTAWSGMASPTPPASPRTSTARRS
jgi:hypothetical protein